MISLTNLILAFLEALGLAFQVLGTCKGTSWYYMLKSRIAWSARGPPGQYKATSRFQRCDEMQKPCSLQQAFLSQTSDEIKANIDT